MFNDFFCAKWQKRLFSRFLLSCETEKPMSSAGTTLLPVIIVAFVWLCLPIVLQSTRCHHKDTNAFFWTNRHQLTQIDRIHCLKCVVCLGCIFTIFLCRLILYCALRRRRAKSVRAKRNAKINWNRKWICWYFGKRFRLSSRDANRDIGTVLYALCWHQFTRAIENSPNQNWTKKNKQWIFQT